MHIDGNTVLEGIHDKTNKIVGVGSSPTVGIILNINGEKYFAKGYLNAATENLECTDELGVDYEAKIYEKIIPKLSKLSPNFINSVCNTTIFDGDNANQKNAYDKLINILLGKSCYLENEEEIKKKGINLIVTQYIPNSVPLKGFNKKLTSRDIQTIVAQVVINLIFMENIKLAHNDIHLGNILIEELPVETMLVYNIPCKSQESYNSGNSLNLSIPNVRYKIYLFDWDVAFSPEIGVNHKIADEFYTDLGIKNQYDSRFDLFTFLCTMRVKFTDRKFANFLDKISPDFDRIFHEVEKVGFHCRLQNPFLLDDSFTATQRDVLAKTLSTKYLLEVLK